MIQRIQSLYLLVIALLMGLMFWLPIASILGSESAWTLTALGFRDGTGVHLMGVYGLTIVAIVAALLALVMIFLYKNRLLQLRLSIVALILLVGVIVFEVYYIVGGYGIAKELGGGLLNVGIVAIFPLIAIVLDLLAIRGIRKDIVLVRSLDRIR